MAVPADAGQIKRRTGPFEGRQSRGGSLRPRALSIIRWEIAEVASVDPQMVFPLPEVVPTDWGSAIPLNYLTAHFALHRRATSVNSGESCYR